MVLFFQYLKIKREERKRLKEKSPTTTDTWKSIMADYFEQYGWFAGIIFLPFWIIMLFLGIILIPLWILILIASIPAILFPTIIFGVVIDLIRLPFLYQSPPHLGIKWKYTDMSLRMWDIPLSFNNYRLWKYQNHHHQLD